VPVLANDPSRQVNVIAVNGVRRSDLHHDAYRVDGGRSEAHTAPGEILGNDDFFTVAGPNASLEFSADPLVAPFFLLAGRIFGDVVNAISQWDNVRICRRLTVVLKRSAKSAGLRLPGQYSTAVWASVFVFHVEPSRKL
jgi:hypothetical protein